MAEEATITSLAPEGRQLALRIVEALLFASDTPLPAAEIARHLPEGSDVEALLAELQRAYSARGVHLKHVAGHWMFQTAPDLAYLLRREQAETRRLSRPALETLAIIAYHQPVTRAEIEEVRGVSTSKGSIDVLMGEGWVRMRGRRRTPGRPITYGTTEAFLIHFGLEAIGDLPGLDELKGAGLLDGRIPPGFQLPQPQDGEALTDDEDPLDPGDLLPSGLADPD